jgi:PncC family amidohydrolase
LERGSAERITGERARMVGSTPKGRGLERQVIRLLRERGLTAAVAESCTGGLVGHRLTSVPGSSASFLGGVIAYHNSVKASVLGVAEELLASEGAVSEAVALAMARGVRRLLRANIGVSVTGIAGPSGGGPGKPVGLVYIALDSGRGQGICQRHIWRGDRWQNKERSAAAALRMLRDYLARTSRQRAASVRRPQ